MRFAKLLLPTLVLVLVSCSSTPSIQMDPEVIHKKDLTFCVDGIGCYSGAGVVPKLEQYRIEVAPKKEESMDRVVFSTCHRTKPYYIEEIPVVDLPFFNKIFGKKKRGISWEYQVDQFLESECDLYIYSIDFESEDHSWAVLRMENPKYTLPARLYCDGNGGRDYNGVSVCDGKAGSYQRIDFQRAVQIDTPERCSKPIRISAGHYKFKLDPGKCPYLITAEDGTAHSLLVFGYEEFKFQKK